MSITVEETSTCVENANETQTTWTPIWRPSHTFGHPVCDPKPCEECGKLFQSRIDKIRLGHGKFCGAKCANTFRGKMATAAGDRAEKIRANGLINERIKRGEMFRPEACENCGRAGRVDAHHPDYCQPETIVFLCRSCHAKAHHHPEIAASVATLAYSRVTRRQKGGTR